MHIVTATDCNNMQKRRYSAKETCNFKEPTNRSHPIGCYRKASINRLLKITGLFCRISSLLYGSLAKETYNLRSLPIEATPSGGIGRPSSINRLQQCILLQYVLYILKRNTTSYNQLQHTLIHCNIFKHCNKA